MKTQKKPYPGTQAIQRVISLLQIFSDAQPEWCLADIVQETKFNRTTLYRLLSVLEDAGLVAYNPSQDTYRLGSEMIVLGARALRANPLREATRPELVTLARKTGEMASLEVLEGNKTLILDEIKGQNQRRLSTSIGNLWPAHTTSTGKVLLAHLSKEERREILPEPLPRLTPQTITDMTRLHTRLNQVRQQGYATAINELELGLTEVATPLYNYEGQAVAAVSISGPTIRLPEQKIPGVVKLLKDTAMSISMQLGYRP